MARRSDHSRDEIKEMALVAGERIIEEEGYKALTARRVSSAIGYTVGSLYLVFSNLDDLRLQINARTLDQLLSCLDAVIKHSNSPEDCIKKLAREYYRFVQSNELRWLMIFEHKLPKGVETPSWYVNHIAKLFECIDKQFYSLDRTKAQTESEMAARALWSGVHGICILASTGKLGVASVETVEPVVDVLVDNFLTGWAAV
ncbi:MAG: TetR/AcrR family transcriptional regulator [Methylococcales bacterium]